MIVLEKVAAPGLCPLPLSNILILSKREGRKDEPRNRWSFEEAREQILSLMSFIFLKE